MTTQNYAAIDIGSNAVRLLISYALEEDGQLVEFRKYSLVRTPIRLGEDVFLDGKISDYNAQRLIAAMQAYKLLMQVYDVKHYRACATSAMREAQNGKQIVEDILRQSDIAIEIIDGNDEASIIADNHLNAFMDNKKNYLYVDVGGGSTEFTIYEKGERSASCSFKIGTLRLLNDMVHLSYWEKVKDWIVLNTQSYEEISLVGSGGNINKIFKSSGEKEGTPLSLDYLQSYYEILQGYSYEKRIRILKLNPDRADVITHAAQIFLRAMEWSNAKNIYVPKIGLSDGIIKDLYRNQNHNNVDS